jgi:hypothetical protein
LCENNRKNNSKRTKEMNFIASAKAHTIARVSLVIGTGIVAGMFTLTGTPASASTWDSPAPLASTWDVTSTNSTWDAPPAGGGLVNTTDSTWD